MQANNTHNAKKHALSKTNSILFGEKAQPHPNEETRTHTPASYLPAPLHKRCCRYQVVKKGMLRPRGSCGLEAKLFGLGLTLSGLGLDLGLMASGLIEIGLEHLQCT